VTIWKFDPYPPRGYVDGPQTWAIFRILAEHDYRGWVSIEDGMNGMDEMAESLAFLRRMSAKYFRD